MSGLRHTAMESIARWASPPLHCDHCSCHTLGGRPHVSDNDTGSSGAVRPLREANPLAKLKNSSGVPDVAATC
jgi:hypothetical protein